MHTEAIQIRVATPADAPLLAELGARTFYDTFAADNTEADMSLYLARSFSPEIQAAELSEPATSFLIASVDGEPAGYTRLRAGVAPACICGEKPLEIVRFYAAARWIGRGVGSTLMEASGARASAHGYDVVWLDVWDQNARAIEFYRRWQFVVVGEQDFILGEDVQHDLLMARPVLL